MTTACTFRNVANCYQPSSQKATETGHPRLLLAVELFVIVSRSRSSVDLVSRAVVRFLVYRSLVDIAQSCTWKLLQRILKSKSTYQQSRSIRNGGLESYYKILFCTFCTLRQKNYCYYYHCYCYYHRYYCCYYYCCHCHHYYYYCHCHY